MSRHCSGRADIIAMSIDDENANAGAAARQALSDVEVIKTESLRLRGTLEASLADELSGALSPDDVQIIKFHGSYQQDDRDVRERRRRQKLEPAYAFMLRLRLPAGVLSGEQWLGLQAIADRCGCGSLRVTTRQSIQLHGIRKRDLKAAIQAVNALGLDSIAACGDVNRNIIVSADPTYPAVHATLVDLSRRLAKAMAPRSRAYREIWLDAPPAPDSGREEEPLYGPGYLPRKFKIAFALPPYNDVDVLAHDLGFTAIVEDGELQGFNVSVGGGMGRSYERSDTYPRLASTLGSITPDRVLPMAETVVALQRDHGNRGERKVARLKYTIDRMGLEAFGAELERRLGFGLSRPHPVHFLHNDDRLGWVRSIDGRRHLTLLLESGRVSDAGEIAWRSGLAELVEIHGGALRLTPNQNLMLVDVSADKQTQIERLVATRALDAYRRASAIRRLATACVALPTCPLAMAEAERHLSDFLEELERRLERHGLAQLPISVRLSGCPNGCSRPYLGEIALTGRAPGRYSLYLGGSRDGARLNRLDMENADTAEILDRLDAVFEHYARAAAPEEPFGDFVQRALYTGAET